MLEKAGWPCPRSSLVWADGGYAGKLVEWARAGLLEITVEIVRKPAGLKTFQVLPRRWVVERTFAWIVSCRRLDHDYERLPDHAEAMIKWAMIGLMVRRLARPPGAAPGRAPQRRDPFPNTYLVLPGQGGSSAEHDAGVQRVQECLRPGGADVRRIVELLHVRPATRGAALAAGELQADALQVPGVVARPAVQLAAPQVRDGSEP